MEETWAESSLLWELVPLFVGDDIFWHLITPTEEMFFYKLFFKITKSWELHSKFLAVKLGETVAWSCYTQTLSFSANRACCGRKLISVEGPAERPTCSIASANTPLNALKVHLQFCINCQFLLAPETASPAGFHFSVWHLHVDFPVYYKRALSSASHTITQSLHCNSGED